MPGKTVAEKLLIRPGSSLWVSDHARRALLEPLPDAVRDERDPAPASTAVVFADDAASVRRTFADHGRDLAGSGNLWVLYPKGNKADINRDSLWPILVPYGLRPITQVAIDDTWSALRFRALKEGEAPFTGGR